MLDQPTGNVKQIHLNWNLINFDSLVQCFDKCNRKLNVFNLNAGSRLHFPLTDLMTSAACHPISRINNSLMERRLFVAVRPDSSLTTRVLGKALKQSWNNKITILRCGAGFALARKRV